MLVDAGRAIGAGAGADGELAAFEVAQDSASVGVRYSSAGLRVRRRAMKERWASMVPVG
ncbi:hypothetical protein GCM10010255_82870 [Streptomyces coeruleofuscus]|uniref:Uncharacterized protein n=1 Tax=Streptomyces coeruleofuscus TaxID=66879 RepID=A0ABP5WI16_9ACTN